MKKRLLLIVPIILLCMMVFAKQTDAGYPALNLTSDAKTISAGQKTQLKVGGVKASKIKWTTSNKKVATVSKKGVVTGVSAGKATVTGKYRGVKFTVKFTVTEKVQTYNKLLCKNDYLSVYLKEIKNGKIFLEIKNKSKHDFYAYTDYIQLNDEIYYTGGISETFYAGLSKIVELKLVDENYDNIDYHFTKGKFKGQLTHYATEESINPNDLKFSTTIK